MERSLGANSRAAREVDFEVPGLRNRENGIRFKKHKKTTTTHFNTT